MYRQDTPIDFVAYNRDGTVLLLAQTKSRLGTSDEWAAEFRRNMLEHGVLTEVAIFPNSHARSHVWLEAGEFAGV